MMILNMILILFNVNNIIIKENLLLLGFKFILKLVVRFFFGLEGFVVFEFEIVGVLNGGNCSFFFYEGIVFEMEFVFSCIGWKDKKMFFYYEF